MNVPSEPGGFVGDIYYGDPDHTTLGTHRWNGSEWVSLPTEAEALMTLLGSARAENAALRRQLAEAREVKPEQVEMLAKEMQAIVAADRWKGRSLDAAPPEKWHRLRHETQQFWIDTAARILSALKGTP